MTFDKKYILPVSVILGLVIAFSLFGFNGFDRLVGRVNLAAVTTSSGCDSIYTSSYCATVPYVMNLTEAEAVGALKSAGFSSVSVVYKLVASTSYGRVFSINVAQGSKVVKTATISISVSTNTTNPPSTTPPPAGGTVPASSLPVIDKLYVKEKADVLKYAEKFYSKKYKETKKLGYKNKDILNKISFKFNTNVQIKSTELSIKSVRKENSYE